jgi:ABC-type methionine transport system ATPase subunit
VTIARALLGDPEALLLDEPTAALDPPNAALVVDTIAALRQSHGLTIVVVTHQPELIRRLGGCVLYLVGGRVQAYECMDGIAHELTDRRVRAFLDGQRPRAAR